MKTLVCLAATLVLTPLAAAQTPTPPLSPSDEQITVTAPPLPERAHTFVQNVITAPHQAQVARWNHRICVSVVGLTDRDQGQYIVDHISRHAHDFGLQTLPPGCRANVSIYVTPDSQAFTQEFVRLAPFAFSSGNTNGNDAFLRFQSERKPVRWWHVSETYTDYGSVVRTNDPSAGGMRSRRFWGNEFHDGLVSSGVHENLDHAFIIVDSTLTAGVSMEALADYLSMVVLASLNPDADMRQFPTILNLFADATPDNPRPERMSAWDIAYLNGVYHMQRNAVSARRQRGEIAARIVGALRARD